MACVWAPRDHTAGGLCMGPQCRGRDLGTIGCNWLVDDDDDSVTMQAQNGNVAMMDSPWMSAPSVKLETRRVGWGGDGSLV